MSVDDKESRLRARAMSIAIDSAVDRLMGQRGVTIPTDPVDAVFARAAFLDGLTGLKVAGPDLRETYTALHAALGEMGAEPIPLDAEYVDKAERFLEAIRSL